MIFRMLMLAPLLFLVACQPLSEIKNNNILTAVGYASISDQRGNNDDEKKKFQGKAEVQRAIERMIAMDNTIASKVSQIHIHGEFGFWEWEYTTTDLQQIRGCDYFEFSKEFIHVKNAYRKLGANRTKNDG